MKEIFFFALYSLNRIFADFAVFAVFAFSKTRNAPLGVSRLPNELGRLSIDLRSSLLTLMFIDLERDSAIRVEALMVLTAYSVRKS